MPKKRQPWDAKWKQWEREARGWLAGTRDEPPPDPKTHDILELIDLVRTLSDVIAVKSGQKG